MVKQYWETFYWNGFSPESICAERLKESAIKIGTTDVVSVLSAFVEARELNTDDFYVTSSVGKSVTKAILWHKNTFLGATNSGDTCPGDKCFSFIFNETGEMIHYKKID